MPVEADQSAGRDRLSEETQAGSGHSSSPRVGQLKTQSSHKEYEQRFKATALFSSLGTQTFVSLRFSNSTTTASAKRIAITALLTVLKATSNACMAPWRTSLAPSFFSA